MPCTVPGWTLASVLGGQVVFAGIILVFFVLPGVGALMYRKMGPPPTP
ncbi:MAG TPA: hypothetical protein VHG51_06460 [Longimicrobiaceae bacterium]|nr:hypothetical protein [Longimicrobiaceae bacterium]